jgi:hypothetical protein
MYYHAWQNSSTCIGANYIVSSSRFGSSMITDWLIKNKAPAQHQTAPQREKPLGLSVEVPLSVWLSGH